MSKEYEVKEIVVEIERRKILNHISLKFTTGLNVIVGESGAGKSTLLNILGLIDNPTEGEMVYEGQSITTYGKNEQDSFRGKNIGFIFQQNNLISDMTVKENLELAMEINGIEIFDYSEVLKKLKIMELLDKKVMVLSGGEQQRVAIARALLKDSDIILADEPTGNLDKANSEIVFQALKECSEKYGKIVIVVTHDQVLANKYADHLIEMEDGEVIREDRAQKIHGESLDRKIEAEVHADNTKKVCTSGEKKKLSLQTKVGFAKGYFKRKPKRTIAIAVISAIAIAICALVVYINNQAKAMFDDMNTNYLETDFVQVYAKDNGRVNSTSYGTGLKQQEIEEIRNSNLFTQTTDFIEMNLIASVYEESGQSDYVDTADMAHIRYIEGNDFYKNRIMSNDIDGEFISNDKEVILGEDICRILFQNENAVGKKIKLEYGKASIVVTIAGVNKTQNVEGIYLSYIPASLTYEIAQKNISEFLTVDLKEIFENSGNVYSGGCSGNYGKNSDYPVIEGYYPTKAGEIAIDIKMAEPLMEESGKPSLLGEEVYVIVDDPKLFKIVGIYNSDTTQMVYFNDKAEEEIHTYRATSIYAYISDLSGIDNFESTDIYKKFDCALMYRHLIGRVSDKTDNIQDVLLLLGIIFMILSFVVINTLVGISIKERIYEIGVIRALGGTRLDIKGIYSIECVLIGFISAVMGVVVFEAGKYIVNTTVLECKNSLFDVLDLFVALVCIMLVVIAGQLPIRQINKMKPIDCIRAK